MRATALETLVSVRLINSVLVALRVRRVERTRVHALSADTAASSGSRMFPWSYVHSVELTAYIPVQNLRTYVTAAGSAIGLYKVARALLALSSVTNLAMTLLAFETLCQALSACSSKNRKCKRKLSKKKVTETEG